MTATGAGPSAAPRGGGVGLDNDHFYNRSHVALSEETGVHPRKWSDVGLARAAFACTNAALRRPTSKEKEERQ